MQEIKIRSVLTCETETGVCGTCYGRDLARGTPVNMGEAVGVIAAQSIGEPGTQLTMRTFHIGGAAQISEQSFIESNFDGKLKFKGKNIAKNTDGDVVAMVRNMVVAVVDPDGTERAITASRTARACASKTASRSSAASASPSGIPTRGLSSTEVEGPRSPSRTSSKVSR